MKENTEIWISNNSNETKSTQFNSTRSPAKAVNRLRIKRLRFEGTDCSKLERALSTNKTGWKARTYNSSENNHAHFTPDQWEALFEMSSRRPSRALKRRTPLARRKLDRISQNSEQSYYAKDMNQLSLVVFSHAPSSGCVLPNVDHLVPMETFLKTISTLPAEETATENNKEISRDQCR